MSGWSVPLNWYWLVTDSSPSTQVWQGSTGQFVALANADYVAFLAAGNTATTIDTFVNLCAEIQTYNAALWNNGVFLGANTNNYPPGGGTITLTTLVDDQICTGNPGVAVDLVLPQATLFGSFPIGYPLFVTNKVSTTAAVRVRAQDGTTLLGTVPDNTTGVFILSDNSTANGLWPTTGIMLVFPGAGWGESQGGTGLTGATVVAHAVPIIQSPGTTVNQVVLGDGQILVGQTGADPLNKTVSGDATLADTGALTVTGINGVPLPVGVVNGGTGLATLTAHAVMLGEGTGSVGFATIGTAGRLLVDQGAGANPSFNAMSGDATISNTGALTLASTIVASSAGDASHVAQITFDAKGRLTTVSNVAIAISDGAITYGNESANRVFAGPSSGAAAAPTFRALVGADLPNPSATTLGGVESLASVASKWINQISTSGVPSATQPAFTDISGTALANQGGTGATTLTGLLVGHGTSPFTAIGYTAPQSYTVTDQSGASLTFTSISVQYEQIGNDVIVYGTFVYPATADGSAAKISVPVNTVNAAYGIVPAQVFNNSSVANLGLFPSGDGTATAFFANMTTGASFTNANLSGARIRFRLSYPVT